MALNVQTDNGAVTNANAYISVAQFKAYHTDRGNDYSLFSNPAADVLTATGVFSNAETVTIGGKVYTLQTVLTNVDGNVHIGVSIAATFTNLANAINAAGGVSGTDYAAATTANPVATAAAGAASLTVTAITFGLTGNAIAVSETAVNASWATPLLTGGAGSDTLLATAIVRATDYLDSRFQFKGSKLVTNNVPAANALNTTGAFADGETVTIAGKVYTLQAALTNVDGHVHIVSPDTSGDLTLVNLINAINGGSGVPGVDYAMAEVPDQNVTASHAATGSLMLTSIAAGLAGNAVTTTATCAHAAFTSATLTGGLSPQTTMWPRQAGNQSIWPWFDVDLLMPIIDVFDVTSGFVALVGPNQEDILGVPPAVKNATAEYALRALSILLYQDAPAPVGGRLLVSQTNKVDVIEQSTTWAPSQAGGFAMPSFPAADMMLARAGLITIGRTVYR